MGIRLIFFVIPAIAIASKEGQSNQTSKRVNVRNLPALSPANPGMRQDRRSLKSRREVLGKRPPLGFNLAQG
uniref:Uncharacterized protein n=1 Tax=Zea mays TaxID=4577 RepID=C0PJ55_MAIZE|nr:unknown [Zea mays]